MQGVEINAGGEIILKRNTVAFTSDRKKKPSKGKVIYNISSREWTIYTILIHKPQTSKRSHAFTLTA